jgi:hypothetical protein
MIPAGTPTPAPRPLRAALLRQPNPRPDLVSALRAVLGPAWAVSQQEDGTAVAFGPGAWRLWVSCRGWWTLRRSDGGPVEARWPVVASGERAFGRREVGDER